MLLDLQLDVSDNNLDVSLSLQAEEINFRITNIEMGFKFMKLPMWWI